MIERSIVSVRSALFLASLQFFFRFRKAIPFPSLLDYCHRFHVSIFLVDRLGLVYRVSMSVR